MPKNLTLAIDEDLLDKARIIAAVKRTSVNELVREYLTWLVEREKASDEAREALLHMMDHSQGDMGAWRFNRDDSYGGDPRFDNGR